MGPRCLSGMGVISLFLIVPKALLPKGNGRDVYPRV